MYLFLWYLVQMALLFIGIPTVLAILGALVGYLLGWAIPATRDKHRGKAGCIMAALGGVLGIVIDVPILLIVLAGFSAQ